MASLADTHRLQQLALRSLVLRDVLRVWRTFDLTDIDRSWPAVQQALTALIWLRHRDSSALASRYYRSARFEAGVPGEAPVRLAAPPALEQLDVSLVHVGAVGAKKLIAANRQDASAQTLVKLSGAVGRHVLNGGRDTILGTLKADEHARGYRRVTSSKPCSFCSMLAGRGAVYSADTVTFHAHDHCSCSSEAVFA